MQMYENFLIYANLPKENLVKNTKTQEYVTVRLSEWCIYFFWGLKRSLFLLID